MALAEAIRAATLAPLPKVVVPPLRFRLATGPVLLKAAVPAATLAVETVTVPPTVAAARCW